VILFEHELQKAGIATAEDLKQIQDGVDSEVDEIVHFSDESPNPAIDELYRYLYADEWEMFRDA
jgi:pyruvate dehydrogenase E1 component alpha subunit